MIRIIMEISNKSSDVEIQEAWMGGRAELVPKKPRQRYKLVYGVFSKWLKGNA